MGLPDISLDGLPVQVNASHAHGEEGSEGAGLTERGFERIGFNTEDVVQPEAR